MAFAVVGEEFLGPTHTEKLQLCVSRARIDPANTVGLYMLGLGPKTFLAFHYKLSSLLVHTSMHPYN